MTNQTKKIILVMAIITTSYIVYLTMPRPIPSEILQIPNEILISKSEEVKIFDKETNEISDKLQATLKKIDWRGHIFGVGLAAPQIGYSQRIIALKNSYGSYQTMVNPKIIESRWFLPWTEKCFSLNGYHFLKRYFWIKIQYQDIDGAYTEEIIKGHRAAILQQEIDHLDGILINDY